MKVLAFVRVWSTHALQWLVYDYVLRRVYNTVRQVRGVERIVILAKPELVEPVRQLPWSQPVDVLADSGGPEPRLLAGPDEASGDVVLSVNASYPLLSWARMEEGIVAIQDQAGCVLFGTPVQVLSPDQLSARQTSAIIPMHGCWACQRGSTGPRHFVGVSRLEALYLDDDDDRFLVAATICSGVSRV